MNNRSRPPGVVVPTLIDDDVPAAAAWLCRVFGFTVRLVAGTSHAQLACGEGAGVMLRGLRIEDVGGGTVRTFEPPGDGPIGIALLIAVDDVDAHDREALKQGASIDAAPVTYPYGERQYAARDLAGHRWTFSQTVDDVDPASWGARIG
jgi:uncharacterized glyoxalase superfamily protein PhnB